MKCSLNKIISLILKILIAFYLTMLINETTITTIYQFTLIYFYFFVMTFICSYFFKKIFKNHNTIFTFKQQILFAVLSFLLINFFNIDLPKKYSDNFVKIELLDTKNERSNGFECWINEILIDGENIEVADLRIESNWEIRNNQYVGNLSNSKNYFNLWIPKGKSLELKLGKHAWSGMIRVETMNDSQIYDLYDENGSSEAIHVKEQYQEYSEITKILMYIGLVSLIFYVLNIVFNMYNWYKNKKDNNELIENDVNKEKKFEIITKKDKLVFLLISFHITFSLVGYSIFLPIEKEMIIIADVLNFIKYWIIISIILVILIRGKLIKNLKTKILGISNLSKKQYFFMILLASLDIVLIIFCLIQLLVAKEISKDLEFIKLFCLLCSITIWMIIVLCKLWKHKSVSTFEQAFFMILGVVFPIALVCYPGCLSNDSIDQITQCYTLLFSDHHPIMHTLFEKVLLFFINNVMFITIMQVLIYVYVVARWGEILVNSGLNKKFVFIVIFIITILPSTLTLVITLWKDILFSIGLLWLSLLLAEYLAENRKLINNVRYWLEVLLACLFVGTFRHNGLLIIFGLLLILIIFYLVNKIRYTFKLTGLFISCIVIVLGCKTFALRNLNVLPNGSLASIIPIHGIAYGIYMDEDLPVEVMSYMDEFFPIELLKEKYYAYSANTYMFDSEAVKFGTMDKLRNSNIPEVIGLYLKTFVKNPYFLIKDRLYGTDTLWNVFSGEGSYQYIYDFNIPQNKLGISRFINNLQIIFSQYADFGMLLAPVVYRVGLCLDILLIVFYLVVKKKRYHLFLVSLPLVLNVVSLMLSMAWQDFRYVWFVQLIVPFLVLYYFTKQEKSNEKV